MRIEGPSPSSDQQSKRGAVGDHTARPGLQAVQVLPEVYGALRRIAAQRIRRMSPGQTLNATALVHEAYMRLARDDNRRWTSREHFVLTASVAMRRIIVDHARRKAALKRGAERLRLTLAPEVVAARVNGEVDVLEIDEALLRLEERDERKARIVTLRFFGGLSIEETALALGVSRATADRDWAFAKAWLHRELFGEAGAVDGCGE